MNKKFLTRTKSFLWRLGMMIVVALANYVSANLTGYHLSPELTLVVGLIAGEVSKYFNNELSDSVNID